MTIICGGKPVARLIPIDRDRLLAALVGRFSGLPAIDPARVRADVDALIGW